MSADVISHVIPGPAQRRIGTGERGVGGVLGAILGNGEKPLGYVCISIVFVTLGACGHLEPSLETVYGEARVVETDQPPLVFVHGVFGSQLRDAQTSQPIWPPNRQKRHTPASDAAGLTPAHAQALSKANQPYALDGTLFQVLEQFAGYYRAEVGVSPSGDGHPYYVFLYDWRQDSVEIARQLDTFLQKIRQAYDDTSTKVDIIAHGTGGLIVRYYLRYGTKDVTQDNEFPVSLAGSQHVRRVILLGTPNLGSVEMLRTVAAGTNIDGVELTPDWTSQLPSLYQFFPHPITQPLVSADGTLSAIDHFDIDTWTINRWGPFAAALAGDDRRDSPRLRSTVETYLERGRRFIWSLTVPVENPLVRFVVFGGACHETAAKALIEHDGEIVRLRFSTKASSDRTAATQLLLLEPGDGLVTKSSLLARQTLDPTIARHRYSFFPLHYASFFCAKHNELDRNYDLQNNLLNALLSADPS